MRSGSSSETTVGISDRAQLPLLFSFVKPYDARDIDHTNVLRIYGWLTTTAGTFSSSIDTFELSTSMILHRAIQTSYWTQLLECDVGSPPRVLEIRANLASHFLDERRQTPVYEPEHIYIVVLVKWVIRRRIHT